MTPDLCNAQSFPQASFYMASDMLLQRSQYSWDDWVPGLGFSWPKATACVVKNKKQNVQAVKLSLKRTVWGVVTSATASSCPSDRPSSAATQIKGTNTQRGCDYDDCDDQQALGSRVSDRRSSDHLSKFCRGLAWFAPRWIWPTGKSIQDDQKSKNREARDIEKRNHSL